MKGKGAGKGSSPRKVEGKKYRNSPLWNKLGRNHKPVPESTNAERQKVI